MSVSNDAAGFQQFVDNKMAYAHMVKLHIDKEFINRMLLLASNDAAKVLESIPKDEIAHVSYDEGGLPVLYANTHEARQHFHQLCCFLQSLPNVSDACLLLQDHVGTRLGDIARSMPHLTSMTILPRLCQGENVSDLAVGLRHHSSIHSIDIQIQPGFYHALLPALETLPQLESLTLNNPYCTMISMLNAEAAARRADNVADFAPQLNPQAFHEFEQLAAQVPNDNDEQGLEEFDPENMTAINSLAVAQVLQTSSLRVTVCVV
ncbi:hypothetical protein MPSEU_000672100 [Mayamaea pseudoterrestris]|nr:hypothetical protein MPSEU_000672100 [Mayamaea pseudoterrestris]